MAASLPVRPINRLSKWSSQARSTWRLSLSGSVVTNTTLNRSAAEGGIFFRACAIVDICNGQTSGQCVYPKKRSVVYPCVLPAKSYGVPDVSVRVNLGLGRGGETIPPWYLASAAPAAAVP